MSPRSSTESYPAFAYIGLSENAGKKLNQVTFPDRESNLGHLVLRARRAKHYCTGVDSVKLKLLKSRKVKKSKKNRISFTGLDDNSDITNTAKLEIFIRGIDQDVSTGTITGCSFHPKYFPPFPYVIGRLSHVITAARGMSEDDDDKDVEGRRENAVAARSLFLSNITKAPAKLNVPVRLTNHYQQ
ncbi:hypothetical protein ANN_19655 [Periplaneta americana]|uniref:Uncharacterized protein n=1 Tax=Periplaneta americana TaxID=6978 RepID=A0ABQ8SBJ5_PERAM|nr:hypothetical protein ANN_19655 [Periplaneta americana]